MDWLFWAISLLAVGVGLYLFTGAARMNEEADEHETMLGEGLEQSLDEWKKEVERARKAFND